MNIFYTHKFLRHPAAIAYPIGYNFKLRHYQKKARCRFATVLTIKPSNIKILSQLFSNFQSEG